MRSLLCILILVISQFATIASACTPPQSDKTFAEIVAQADVIFYGKPIVIGNRYPKETMSNNIKVISENYFSAPYEVTFEVDKIWKGTKGSHIYIMENDSSCGNNLRNQLEKYMLVFAKFDDVGLHIMLAGSEEFNQLSDKDRIRKLGKAL